jgi:hypothetical protein
MAADQKTKRVVEECVKLTVWMLRKAGLFGTCQYQQFGFLRIPSQQRFRLDVAVDLPKMEIRLAFVNDSSESFSRGIEHTVELETTPCNFGKKRYWFICLCGRRVGALYLPPRGHYFGCRHCYQLSYRSRNEDRYAALHRLDRYRPTVKRLTWRGKPTRKARRLRALEHRSNRALVSIRSSIARLRNSILRHC